MRVVFVPSTLALLPEYASLDDPIADLRKAVDEAVAWLLEDGPATALRGSPSAHRIAEHLLGGGRGDGPGMLVVANGSATRTEKAPGHLDERAAAFDAAIGRALAEGDQAALGAIDPALAEELWAMPDADVLRRLVGRVGPVTEVQVDYDDDPYGVQYWVVRWQCGS
jgi:hypothetical protein